MLFEDVYERHFYRIYSYIRKHVNHQQDSEDLTADVFVTAYKYWHDYDPARCPVLAWLYMIASSRLKNYYRDRKNEYSLDIPEINDRIGSENYCDQAVVLMDERKTLLCPHRPVQRHRRPLSGLRPGHQRRRLHRAGGRRLLSAFPAAAQMAPIIPPKKVP